MEINFAAAQENQENREGFNDLNDELESDVDDDQLFDEDEFSSPSTNSDGIQFGNNQWYAYRGRINVFENGVNNPEVNHQIPPILLPPQPLQIEHPEQPIQNEEEEETDFLEMDFEPENSEIENENELINGQNDVVNGNHDNQLQNNQALENFHQASTSSHHNNHHHTSMFDEPCSSNHQHSFKNTGAKPKVLKEKPIKQQRQVSDGDNVFKITGHLYDDQQQYCDSQMPSCSSSSSSAFFRSYQDQPPSFFKPHRSPVKSCHKQQQNLEKQSEQFLFEIEPIRPRNSVTIYTSNCDEKILMDALTSLKLNPSREMISNYFKELKQAPPDLGLVDYIIHRSKLNCNYIKLIELIEKACKDEEDESYNSKRIEINFYPLDFFSTTPEMIEIEVHEIVKRWTPQTDLTELICIKNKHFYQTNVLGKIVNLIRRVNGNHKPGSALIFHDNETIKIPQFYVSGYITITSLRNHQT